MAVQKIAHLTSVHQHTDTRIFHKECKSLQKSRYEVVLIVPHREDESIDGVTIRAVPVPRNRRMRMSQTLWQVYRAALREEAQVYHFHDPELMIVGILLKLKGKKVIYDVHEDLPRQILSKGWIPSWLRRAVSAAAELAEGVAGKCFDQIIAVTPTIAARFPKERTTVVKNYPLLDELIVPSPPPYRERANLVSYIAAGITLHRGLKEMVEAIGMLPEEAGARLVLAGKLSPPSLREEQGAGWERVVEAGFLDRNGVRQLLSTTKIGLVAHHPLVNYIDSIPVKLFEYMAAGVPVVASRFPLWAEFVEGNRCGICVNPLDAAEIAEAVKWLLEHPEEAEQMGKNGQQAVQTKYNWDMEAKKLLCVYEALCSEQTTLQSYQTR
jgi:glycosyltransferase involved in cell wall biosynthesis